MEWEKILNTAHLDSTELQAANGNAERSFTRNTRSPWYSRRVKMCSDQGKDNIWGKPPIFWKAEECGNYGGTMR